MGRGYFSYGDRLFPAQARPGQRGGKCDFITDGAPFWAYTSQRENRGTAPYTAGIHRRSLDMGLFDRWKQPDFDTGLEQFAQTPGAVLLDVRTRQEFAQGSVPGSRNIPLQELEAVQQAIPQQDTPVFVYCLSGARSRQAAALLQRMGYSSVVNLGGICNYHGKVAVQA